MAAPADLTGLVVNDLTVIEFAGHHTQPNGTRVRAWKCQCVCGNTRVVTAQILTYKKIISCGCSTCVECQRRFQRRTRLAREKYCSKECEQTANRRRWREYYHQLSDEKKKQMQQRHKKKRQSDPDWARKIDRRKWIKDRDNPQRREARKKYAREHYHAQREKILEERRARHREKMESMSAHEREEFRERMRSYTRKYVENLREDSQKWQQHQERERQYRQRQAAEALLEQQSLLSISLAQRNEEAARQKPCCICGKPLVGKRSCATVCSTECRRKKTLAILYPTRERPCLACGKSITDKTSRKICSDECRKARANQQRRTKRERGTP